MRAPTADTSISWQFRATRGDALTRFWTGRPIPGHPPERAASLIESDAHPNTRTASLNAGGELRSRWQSSGRQDLTRSCTEPCEVQDGQNLERGHASSARAHNSRGDRI